MKRLNTILTLILLLASGQLEAQVNVTGLKCELANNPQGIDIRQPHLSWQITSGLRDVRQTGYHILVATAPGLLDETRADAWNTGEARSSASVHIPYEGIKLKSGTRYFWKVKVYTNKGNSGWSKPAEWSMGLLDVADWKAKWIGYDKASTWDSVSQWSRLSARYLRKEFQSVKKIKSATVFISGLGMYELFINGKRVGNQVLAPNPTDYRQSYFYQAHDVTSVLKQGQNAIATVLGNGRFFTMRQNYKTHKHNNFGFPRLLLQLQINYDDGSSQVVVSDERWKLNVDGPIRTNNEYDGEEYDARKELTGWTQPGFNDRSWMIPELVESPQGKRVAQLAPSMRVMKTIKPVSIKRFADGKYILDMGQNFAGWIRLQQIKGKAGQRVVLRFAESLQKNGTIFTANLRDAKVTDVYTLKGGRSESWRPSFVYHGFRYVEVSEFPGTPSLANFVGEMVYDDVATTGSFATSDSTINTIYRNAWWGIASNYKGMPVDCPQRNERQPWLGDRTIGAQGESYMFDNANLYYKWMNDIAQAQTPEGAIPDVAPAFWNYYSDNVTWPAAFITINNHLYNQYGDIRAIAQHYPAMKKWMGYMRQRYMKNYIVTKDKYGDWCVPPESLELIHARDSSLKTDGQLIATAYYFKLLGHMQRFARLLKQEPDAAYFASLADSIGQAFQRKFYNADKKYYSNNTVTANLLPLYFGICPDSLRPAVIDKIRHKVHVEQHDHISTGLIGSQWLMRGLTEFNLGDLAYTLASQTTYPSWGYMAANGATTIWELWNGNTADPGMNSQNHVMLLGDLITWYYENLGGIRSHKTDVAFRQVIMKPFIPAGLKFVNASYESLQGPIKSSWTNEPGLFKWDISIPANTSATVYFPANDSTELAEGGKPLAASGISILKQEHGYVVLQLPSGDYKFIRNKKWKAGIVEEKFIFQTAAFPESHSATIAETPAGLIAAWFGGTKEGNKDVCIWTSRLENNKWTAPQLVADGVLNDSTRFPCFNPVLYYAPNGELLLFYKIGPNVGGWTGWMKRSSDNGLSWREREKLPEGYLGPVKNKPVLIDGQLVCPSSTERNGWKVHLEYTNDFGKTWTKSAPINDGKSITAIQPSILQYKNGALQVLCRSRNRTLNESWSFDRGKTWSAMQASALPNNNSGTDAVTLQDGRQLLVYNHVKPAPELPNGKGPRTPLNVAISSDGKQWQAALVLEDSPISQYSYPAVIQSKDGMVHIVYTWRRERIKYVKVDPRLLKTEVIVAEQWPGAELPPTGTVTQD